MSELTMRLSTLTADEQQAFLQQLLDKGHVELHRHVLASLKRMQAAEVVAPHTESQKIIADVWGQFLQKSPIGIDDDFFEMGGHSILATQIMARLNDLFGQSVPLECLFSAPTIRQLVKHFEGAGDGTRTELPPIGKAPPNATVPLSSAQERIWFLSQLEPESAAYLVPRAIRLRGLLDYAALERSFDELLRRHEVLRTSFPDAAGMPYQQVHPYEKFHMPVIDLTQCEANERTKRIESLIVADRSDLFDVANGPLMRVKLLAVGPEEHILLWTQHHLIHDGWTQDAFVTEITILYNAFRRGERSPLAELPIQFADFAYWQHASRDSEVMTRQLAYWKEKLAGAPAVTRLPSDYPRKAVQSPDGRSMTLTIPAEVARIARRMAREESVTLFMVFFAAFALMLHRHSGEEEICIGSGVANRRRREAESVLGMIINTVVLRTNFRDDPSFRELLHRVRTLCIEAYANQDVPFARVVEALKPQRSTEHSALFQTMFSFHDVPASLVHLDGLEVSDAGSENVGAKFDLNVTCVPFAEKLSKAEASAAAEDIDVLWEWRSEMFEAETIKRLHARLTTVLKEVGARREQPISAFTLIPSEERKEILEWSSGPEVKQPSQRCLHDLVWERAAEAPDAVALVYRDEQMSYGEMVAAAGRVARRLRARGVGPEVVVGVCAERSPAVIVALLGILKAGGAYLPLDPDLPKERIAFMLNDARSALVLASDATAECLPAEVQRLPLDGGDDPLAAPDTPPSIHPANLAYVIYTSGSTGKPKGVMVPHEGATNTIRWKQSTFGLERADRMVQKTSLSFDVSVGEIFWPLSVGASLVLLEHGRSADAEYVAQLMSEKDVTAANFVPSLLRSVLDAPDAAVCKGLRRLMCIGEELAVDLVQRSERLFPNAAVTNLYGPTEASIEVTFWHCSKEEKERIPIGFPIANTQVYVLDGSLRPLPPGCLGEIYIGGVGLARGYSQAPALTAERFPPSPFGEGERLYRTGDIGSWNGQGQLEFHGRSDHQIKLRGFRIEMGEVENALRALPGVSDAAVIDWTPIAGERRLVGYLTQTRGEVLDEAHIRDALRSRLPRYMIPAMLVISDHLPTNASGKLDRSALPPPDRYRSTLSQVVHQGRKPETPTEIALAAIWQRLLEVPDVQLDDDFFELGGHSLLATRAIYEIRRRFGEEFPLRDFFMNTTIATLAQAIDARRNPLPALGARQQSGWVSGQITPS